MLYEVITIPLRQTTDAGAVPIGALVMRELDPIVWRSPLPLHSVFRLRRLLSLCGCASVVATGRGSTLFPPKKRAPVTGPFGRKIWLVKPVRYSLPAGLSGPA